MAMTNTNLPPGLPMVAFGAHPDDVEFGCGGIIAKETRAGRAAHLVVCSRGEAATHGTPEQRVSEAEKAASLLGATIEFVELDGDAHLEVRASHILKIAGLLRRLRPALVLAPSLPENQHPDHARLGRIVRDAARLARYGGVAELRPWAAHAIEHLLYYAVTAEAEPAELPRLLFDISAPEIVAAWTAAMQAHASQGQTRNYVELQLSRARVQGLRAGVGHAMALFPANLLLFDSLSAFGRGARAF
jgi:LmbE family N-acetylglucosaminyl deacetylase